jgi:tetratricopeptide (TPR) repeat protein
MFYDWDFTAAFQYMQQALALNPGDAFILTRAARQYGLLGRVDEAIDLHRQSIVLDPVQAMGHRRLGRTLYDAHRLEEAADSLQMAQSLSPGGAESQYILGLVLMAQGDAPAALVAMERETSDAWRLNGMPIVQHALGNDEASDAALQELIEVGATVAAYQIAEAYAFRGEIDNAFDWLEQAYAIRDPGTAQMLVDPLLANLHDDPRWEILLDKMGLPH